MKKLSCAQARQIDMVDYLVSLSHQPQKMRNQDYWFCSPFRDEKTPSFKVNRNRNIWFDFGEGKGGDIIDFGKRYFNCSVSVLLERLSQNPLSQNLSFHPQPPATEINLNQPFYQALSAGEKKETGSSKILILTSAPLSRCPAAIPSKKAYSGRNCRTFLPRS